MQNMLTVYTKVVFFVSRLSLCGLKHEGTLYCGVIQTFEIEGNLFFLVDFLPDY